MSNKTISINPALFNLNSRTKKNKSKVPKSQLKPIISPNLLKNKLLKRIKEHKQKEFKDDHIDSNTDVKPTDYISDEFTDSLNYLQSLSKQKKIDQNKILADKRREELERRTIRNYHSMSDNTLPSNPVINIDLPEELQQPSVVYKLNQPYRDDNVPYSNLKGGSKPTYREWNKTQRNNVVTNPQASLVVPSSRENRLNLLREKIQTKRNELKYEPILIKNINNNPVIQPQINIQTPTAIQTSTTIQTPTSLQTSTPIQTPTTIPQRETEGKIIATKHITKKTIKRKYMLGRSSKQNTVGVLIKDKNTRKNILNAQKDLKKRNIDDVKIYLKDHNLIKVGSNAPNDVLRKIYESAMLAGEITNSNSDTLLHNFSKET